MLFRVLYFCLFLKCGVLVEGSKILGIFPSPAKSHYTLGNVLLKELAKRGHEVTMISPFEENHPPQNSSYRNIKIEFETSEQDKNIDFFSSDMSNPYMNTVFLNYAGYQIFNFTLNHPKIQQLLQSEEKFDAVIMDQFIFDGFSYFAHRFGACHILLSTTSASSWVNSLVGNPAPPSVVADLLLSFSNHMNFFERLQNSIFYLFSELNKQLYTYPRQNKVIKENLPAARPLYDYLYNVSLVLINSHESFGDPATSVPVMKNIGGFHVSSPKKLPQDLQKFMDDGKEGIVYFSMGSNLKSKDMPAEVVAAMLRVFAKLKVKILWKWEDDKLPGQSANLKLGKWFPQPDVLAHPNVKLFITHGGLLSTIEAVYHGVPLLAIPVYGDQKMNAAIAVRNGYAIDLPFAAFEETKFESALKELLNNPKYKESVEYRSKIFHDRPMKALDEALYWVEYVIRHQGANHLRVAAVNLSWYQYLLLDVAAFVISVLAFVLYILRITFRKLFCRKKTQKKATTSKKLKAS